MATLTPSRFGPLESESAFHLPIPGLLADLDSGSGAVRMTDEFLEAPSSVRIRLVQQWIRALRELKDLAIVEMFRESVAARADATIVEHIDVFRKQCQEAGITCPADLPILLQQY